MSPIYMNWDLVRQQSDAVVASLTPAQRLWAEASASKLAAANAPINLTQLRNQAAQINWGDGTSNTDRALIAIIAILIGLVSPAGARSPQYDPSWQSTRQGRPGSAQTQGVIRDSWGPAQQPVIDRLDWLRQTLSNLVRQSSATQNRVLIHQA